MRDTLHRTEVCQESFAGLAQNNERPIFDGIELFDQYTVIPENIVCKGGDSWQSTGGPTFSTLNDDPSIYQILGVTSFGFNSGACSIGPDYLTRDQT